MRILIIFIFLVSKSFAVETAHIKNLFENKELKKYDELTFLNDKQNLLNLNDFKGKLILAIEAVLNLALWKVLRDIKLEQVGSWPTKHIFLCLSSISLANSSRKLEDLP